MFWRVFLLAFLVVSFLKSYGFCEEDSTEFKENFLCDTIDPDFYLFPQVWIDGHMWRPILLEHHRDCPCQISTQDNQ